MINRLHPVPVVFLVLGFMVFPLGKTLAHDARPLFLNIEQQSAELYHATLAVPSSVEIANTPQVIWPEVCRVLSRSVGGSGSGSAYRIIELIRCKGGLDGLTIGFNYPLFNPSLTTVIRLSAETDKARVAVLPPDKSAWAVPDRPLWWTVAGEYLNLGMEHILGGFDHLLFVTGLLILARTLRRVILVITGFTLAHSVTLSLAALNLIKVAIVPTEAAIALSILFLAAEIARGKESSLAFRYPLLISSTFGLLHGLGFAAALNTIGLPSSEVTSALIFFNLGVELGQIAFIICLLGIFLLVRASSRILKAPSWEIIRTTAGYVMGIPASYWFFLRLAQF